MTVLHEDERDATRQVLLRLSDAWQNRDAEAVAALFGEDGVYAASIGPKPGTNARGRATIHELVEHMFAADRAVSNEITETIVISDRAVCTWRYTLTDGRQELGCDLFTIRDGRIIVKDAYRKVRR